MTQLDQADGDTLVMTSLRITKRHQTLLRVAATPKKKQSDILREVIDKIIDRYANMSDEEIKSLVDQRVSHLKEEFADVQSLYHDTPPHTPQSSLGESNTSPLA